MSLAGQGVPQSHLGGCATAPSLPPQMVRQQKAVVIQAAVRGWLARSHYGRLRGAVIYLQCCYRRARARRELRRLRLEARSVEHYKQLHRGMEIKVIQLQCRLDEQVGAGLGTWWVFDHFLPVPVQPKPHLPLSPAFSQS